MSLLSNFAAGVFCLFLFSSQAFASLAEQRIVFQQVLTSLNQLSPTQFEHKLSQLQNYPLSNYLQYRYYSSHLAEIDETTLSQFISRNDDYFYADRLRQRWLNHLAETKQWSRFLKQYKAPQSVARQCLRLQALIQTGQHQQALKDTPELWLTGRSQHHYCDQPFAFFKQQGKLTESLRWQRIQLALEQRQFSLAKYLAKSVKKPTQAKQWVQQWHAMHKNPSQQLSNIASQPLPSLPLPLSADKAQRDLIQYGLTQLARRSTDLAFQHWQRIKTQYRFDQQQQYDIQGAIALRAALNRQDDTLRYYGDVPHDPWRVRAALWQQDWPAVEKAIRSLKLADQQTTRWQYWLARSYAEQGHQHKADIIYHQLLPQRDYYSFLAADKLDKRYQLNHHPLQFNELNFNSFSQRPDVVSLHEFYITGFNTEARQQSYYLKQRLDKRELEMLATLTHKWGWHNQTIALLGKAKSWDDLDLRFPVLYEQHMVSAGKTHHLDPSWLLGIARQESAFNPKARSPVGARGLMQLMPKTAKNIAKKIKAPIKSLSELSTPHRNIELGTAYLRQVYDQHQQNPVLATASYNAGPHRVSRWLPKVSLPADIWIENIPFNETRKYTANVITYAAIFDHQRGKSITRISRRMADVHPPKSVE